MKIAIVGRTETLLNTAKLLLKNGFEIPLVITAKAAPEYNIKEEDFENFAKSIGADFICTNKINLKAEKLRKHNVDIAVSMNYTSTISEEIVGCFKMGILNAHLGDLPRYRGNATPNWAIINGESSIPMCIQYMIGGELDSGDILNKKYKEILITTKIGEIYQWANEVTPQLYLEALTNLKRDPSFIIAKQSKDIGDIIRCYPRLPEDSKIDWSKSSLEIIRLINASSKPFSGAFTTFDGDNIIIEDAEMYRDGEKYFAVPGQISEINKAQGYVTVITGDGKIKIKNLVINNEVVPATDRIKSIRIRFK